MPLGAQTDFGDVTPEILMRAYAMGVFPMAEHRDDPEIFWVDPHLRGVFPLSGFHMSRSLSKSIKRPNYTISLNHDFEGVLDGCADRSDTWISTGIRTLYLALHNRAQAHSLEVWDTHGSLIGGVYGVSLGGAFFGESMFSRRKDASKIALAFLTLHLKQCGFSLFDTQFITPHLASLGAIEVPRDVYKSRLNAALDQSADIENRPLPSVQDVLQRNTHTS